MDLETMRRLTQNMKQVNEGVSGDDSVSEAEEASEINAQGVRAYEEGDYEKAFKLFLKAAKAGNAWGMRNVAFAYRNGEGVHEDQSEAFAWFKKAANLGNADAMFETGVYYYRGEVTLKDLPRAFAWCKKAAENGIINAMEWIGEFYRDGEGVVQDISKAIQWFEQSAEGGNKSAMFNLAYIYDKGNGVPVNYPEAFKWYEKAAKAGHVSAMNNLAYAYDNGLGVQTNSARAEYWYRKAAKAGNETAKKNLSILLRNRDSCFITTAICKSLGKADDCEELTTLRKFRDEWLVNQLEGKDLIAEYYSIAPQIVNKINSLPNSAQVYKNLLHDYLEPCLVFIEHGNNQACKQLYTEMVTYLKGNYLQN